MIFFFLLSFIYDFLFFSFKQKNEIKKGKTPFYKWGSTASRLEPFRGGSFVGFFN